MREGRSSEAGEHRSSLRSSRSGISIFVGDTDDIPELVDLGGGFFAESNFANLGFDPVKCAETLGYYMGHPQAEVLVARDMHGDLAGLIAFDFARQYTVKPIACMFLFYVRPDLRLRSDAGIELLFAALELLRENGVGAFFASSTAGFSAGNDARLKNLYLKLGFYELGCFMRIDL